MGTRKEQPGTINIVTGRDQTAKVQTGIPFSDAVEKVADDAHYGGYYRVFLNGNEIVDPSDAPETIEAGMQIAICSYDKVGECRWGRSNQ